MPPFFVGIDPGNQGAIASFDSNTGRLEVVDMPVRVKKNGKKEVDASQLKDLFLEIKARGRIRCALYEDVGAMVYVDRFGVKRGQGAASSFAFGKGLGLVLGVMAGLEIQFKGVHSSVWKGLMGLSRDKDLSRSRAMHLFPSESKFFEKKKHDGRAEASLLAWLCHERFK